MDYRAAANEAPDVGIEATHLRLDPEEGSGVADRRLHLLAMADDPRVGEQRLHATGVEPRH